MSARRSALLKIAPPYDDALLLRIGQGFSNLLGYEVLFEVEEERSLLCGFIAYINGKVYDVSGKSQLAKISRHLVDSAIVPATAEVTDE